MMTQQLSSRGQAPVSNTAKIMFMEACCIGSALDAGELREAEQQLRQHYVQVR